MFKKVNAINSNYANNIKTGGKLMKRVSPYPFTAIVGQDAMKMALILNVINPSLGGVLIKGEKGTAKSTAVRALAELLPNRKEVKGCRFHCNPNDSITYCEDCVQRVENGEKLESVEGKMRVVDLPVNATEDRVVGSLDIEHAIKYGKKKFELGILAEANKNILYVDEINLLDDHVVDVLLDASAMGINTVEREGISYSHPSRFVLVGTMNPEEGDIRPQLLDRFGLSVSVEGESDFEKRVQVIKSRIEYEKDPDGFVNNYEEEQKALSKKITDARIRLKDVTIGDDMLLLVAQIAIKLDVDGHRADISVIKTALTIAAFEGRNIVTKEDLKEAAKFVLPHRMRKRPFEEAGLDWEKIEDFFS